MRLKDVSVLSPQYVGNDIESEVSFVPMECLRCGSIEKKEIPFKEAKGKYTYFADGDLLIAKVTPCFENGNIAIAENLTNGIGFGSSEIFVLRMSKEVNTDYMFYLTQTTDFKVKACSTMCGVGGLKRISPLFMRTYEWNFPDIEKQKECVLYLKTKTKAIDQRISILTKKQDCYTRLKSSIINRAVTKGLNTDVELKDSGIDWIEQIPKPWKIKRIKDIVSSMRSGGTPSAGNPDFYVDNGTPWVSIADMSSTDYVSYTNKTLSQKGIDDKSLEIFPSGTLLYSIYASIGKVSELSVPATINQAILALKLKPEYCKQYVKYILRAMEDYAFKNANGNTQYNLNAGIVNNFFILNPPLEEQQAIANYLDEKCAKIDTAIANIDKQIDALKRLKRALINEVVTGKREV